VDGIYIFIATTVNDDDADDDSGDYQHRVLWWTQKRLALTLAVASLTVNSS
jgi:hypothetical protein